MLAGPENVAEYSQMCDYPLFSYPTSHARTYSYTCSWACLDSGVGHQFGLGDGQGTGQAVGTEEC